MVSIHEGLTGNSPMSLSIYVPLDSPSAKQSFYQIYEALNVKPK